MNWFHAGGKSYNLDRVYYIAWYSDERRQLTGCRVSMDLGGEIASYDFAAADANRLLNAVSAPGSVMPHVIRPEGGGL